MKSSNQKPEPTLETRIWNPGIIKEDRNCSLQQCLINSHRENYFIVIIFLALRQPQSVIVKKKKID